jgi:hypothetical protein
MYVTWTSRYIQHSVLSAVSCNCSRSWNVLPMDTELSGLLQRKIVGLLSNSPDNCTAAPHTVWLVLKPHLGTVVFYYQGLIARPDAPVKLPSTRAVHNCQNVQIPPVFWLIEWLTDWLYDWLTDWLWQEQINIQTSQWLFWKWCV